MEKTKQQGVPKVPTGSPVGWSFYSTFLGCPQRWYLRYVLGLVPLVTPQALAIGTVYHALHDDTPESVIRGWGPEFAEAFERGKQLYDYRLSTFLPKLPAGATKEQTLELPEGHPLHGLFTSKPDRLEQFPTSLQVREFKTAGSITPIDAEKWDTSGQIIGELLTAQAPVVLVDVVTKAAKPRHALFTVRLTSAKEQAWLTLLSNTVNRIREAMAVAEFAGNPEAAFPKQLTGCASYYNEACPYYAKCWHVAPKHLLFKHAPQTEWRTRFGLTKPTCEGNTDGTTKEEGSSGNTSRATSASTGTHGTPTRARPAPKRRSSR